ncbi:DUF1858 domain-containing protein [Candidatus Peregrinibacteria bacterium]|jgi:hybrid cluster-associated redox disulfide protein|nr:DUF1858 domain-containing protein [Candidatus Peregrinibacteria bacterium]MBT3598711.1 DUF1858 domain-containing protein [Candidatus Peregrinibacteria bacterium]MBT4586059.1 DUF1858 domain-containing protein [Candidatus Peregrinibacteria bacterium]MBT6731279.1 DUF1858 domain-containing protein [Candidatus Peregrinibacteria bacterium]MBT7008857.1 DUF1858 domain-containing protein [Candidatus Peregrinibacteria bacterium]
MSLSDSKLEKGTGSKIDASMRIQEILTLCPQAQHILFAYGMNCVGCSIGATETLSEACMVHGFSGDMQLELIDDLNNAFESMPKREKTLSLTPCAAKGIQDIAKKEDINQAALSVVIDEAGSFCLEFRDSKPTGEECFSCAEHPNTFVCASSIILKSIGGAVIDYRDGLFKLDLSEDIECCSNTDESCGCSSGDINGSCKKT